MSLRRIKKGDDVIVTTGKDKGRTGTVLSVVSDERVLIENINVAPTVPDVPNQPRRGTNNERDTTEDNRFAEQFPLENQKREQTHDRV